MTTERLVKGAPVRSVPTLVFWVSMAIVGLALLILVEYLATTSSRAGLPFERLVSYQLVSYANLSLMGSTILYLSHLRFTSERVGRWASGFATVGAICLTMGLLVRWVETFYEHSQFASHAPIAGLYEVMSLVSAITVVIYLVMEKVYRTRSAGAFVMPIVVSAVMFEIWLVSIDQASPDFQLPLFKSYWIHAHVLANFIGYGGFAMAALLAGVYLLRHRAERIGFTDGFAIQSLPELGKIDRLMHQAILLGFPFFTFATILGAVSAYQVWGRFWAWDPKETWALVVCLTYALYLFLHYVNHWSGVRAAWWAIIGFALTVFCFFGVNLIFTGLHSYGQSSL